MEAEDIIAQARVIWGSLVESDMYNVRLEEVRQEPTDRIWLITFGGDVVVERPPALDAPAAEPQLARIYRTLMLDSEEGTLLGLRRQ